MTWLLKPKEGRWAGKMDVHHLELAENLAFALLKVELSSQLKMHICLDLGASVKLRLSSA